MPCGVKRWPKFILPETQTKIKHTKIITCPAVGVDRYGQPLEIVAMRNVILIISFLILFNNFAFGQNHAYKSLTDKELAILNDLSSTFKDTTFVISPHIVSIIDSTTLDIPVIINKYAFSKGQFEDAIGDTILIKENKYFKIVCPDSLDQI